MQYAVIALIVVTVALAAYNIYLFLFILLTLVGIIIAFARKSHNRKKAEEETRRNWEAQIENERIAEEKFAFAQSLKSLLDTPTLSNIRKAESMIRKSAGHLSDFAQQETRQYADNIRQVLSEQLNNGNYNGVLIAARLLTLADLSNNEYTYIQQQIETMMAFAKSETPLICACVYGQVSEEEKGVLLQMTCREPSGFDMLVVKDVADIQQVFWKLAQNAKNDLYSYKATINAFSAIKFNGHLNIDVLATLLFVRKEVGGKIFDRHFPDYQREIDHYIERASPKALYHFASVAAWCNAIDVEHRILDQLDRKGDLPENLRYRLKCKEGVL